MEADPGKHRLVPKVMLVITKGETGGAQTHLLSLCQALAGRVQFDVAVGGPRAAASPLSEALGRQGVPVHRLPQLRNSLSPASILGATRALLRVIRGARPDVLHAHSEVAGVVARLAGLIARIPVIYTVHGFGFKPEVPALQRRLAWLAEWILAPLTRHMVCVSEHERRLAARLPLPAGRVSVIANALADTPCRASPEREPPGIVSVARFAAPKRPELLVQALALMRDRSGRETPLTLIGDGPAQARCRALVQELNLHAVRFAGDVTDVPERLAAHEVFVLVSDHEGLPISVIEAMRAGLPIVATDLPGVRELVRSGEEAVLTANRAEALAHALEQLVSTPGLRGRLGRAARHRYEARFTTGPMAEAVNALYVQIAPHEP